MTGKNCNRARLWGITLISFLAILVMAWTNSEAFTLSGIVFDNNGIPAQDIAVQMYYMGNPLGNAFDTTDITGFYSITGLPAATYDVKFTPPPSSGMRIKTVRNFTIISDTTLNVNLLSGFYIAGFVRDTLGIGLPQIDLNVYDQQADTIIITTGDDTDSTGYYDVLVPPGTYWVLYRPIAGQPLVPEQVFDVVVNADTIIDVVLRGGYYVTGTVTGPGGVPVADADLDAEDSFTGDLIYTPGDNTDNAGNYQLFVPPGTYDINVTPLFGNGLVPQMIYNVPVYGPTVLNFNIEAGFQLTGTVINPGGSGVPDVDLNIYDYNTGVKLFTPGDNTNQSGYYQLMVPAGVFQIDYRPPVVPPYLAPVSDTAVAIAGNTVRNKTVPYGYLFSGTVTNSFGAIVPDVDIDATDISTGLDVPLIGDYTDISGYFATVMVAGTYNIDFNPPAVRRLSAERLEGYVLNSDVFTTAVLDTGIYLSGIVTDSTGAGLFDVAVMTYEASSGNYIYATGNKSDSSGFYDVFIPPNTYNLVYKPDSLSGITDSVFYSSVNISSDTIINVVITGGTPDTEPPTVSVLAPNGGENWAIYSTQTIMWNAVDNIGVSHVDILYSTVGPAGPYTPISTGEVNDGYYVWVVPPDTTTNAYVKVVAYDISSNSGEDISNAPFSIFIELDTIPPTVTVLAPNGGEIWPIYSNQTIIWNAVDNIGVSSLDISYSITGPSGPYITIANGEPNDGFYIWTVPPDTTTNAYVKVVAYDISSNSGEDISNAQFTIFGSPSSCSYIIGDVNNSGGVNGLDVVFMVSYFKGGAQPPYWCECTPGNSWYVAGDVNSSCSFNGLDVTYLVGFLKGGAGLTPCPSCPPQ